MHGYLVRKKFKKKLVSRNGLVFWIEGKDYINSPPTSSLTDRSGNNNNATPAGFANNSTSGSDGNRGLAFFGDNDVLTVPHSSSINFNGECTMEFAIKGTNLATTETLLSKAVVGGSSIGYGINLRSTAPFVKFYIYDTGVKGTLTCATDIRDGQKHIIQVRRTVTPTSTLQLYIDNVLISSDNMAIGTYTNTSPLYIGQNYNNGTPTQFLKSTLYFARMYNRAISDVERVQNYYASR